MNETASEPSVPGDRQPLVVGPDEGQALAMGGNRITLKVTAQQTDRFSLVDYQVAPNFSAPPALHFHEREDWAAFVLEGEITFVFDGGEVIAPADSTVLIPRGTPFAWRNDQDTPARYLAVHAPAGFEQFFVDVHDGIRSHEDFSPSAMAEIVPPLWTKYRIRSPRH